MFFFAKSGSMPERSGSQLVQGLVNTVDDREFSSSCSLSSVVCATRGRALFCKKIGLSILTDLGCLIVSFLIILFNSLQ